MTHHGDSISNILLFPKALGPNYAATNDPITLPSCISDARKITWSSELLKILI